MHAIRSPRRRMLVLAAVALFTLAACSGDDDGENTSAGGTGDSTTTTTGDARDGDGKLEKSSGSGEITIAGTTFEFTSDSCGLGSGDVPAVEVVGKGDTGGEEYEVEIVRSQPASNHVERVKLAFSGLKGSVATVIGPAEEVVFQVEDGTVTADGLDFAGGGGAPTGEGSFTLTCE